MEDAAQERVARNEDRFRRVNEAIEAGQDGAPSADRIAFLCECGRLGCNALMELSAAVYEAVRADPHRFLVLPGHEQLEVERVVERAPDYVVVEKTGRGASVAEATDPRAQH